MKTMKIFSVIALLMMGAFTFTSCSDDDDNNGTAYNLALMDSEAVRKAIVGTWAFTETYTAVGSSYHDSGVRTGIAVFNEDGTESYTETNHESYNNIPWALRQNEDGTFELLVGPDIYQISFLSTTTFIVTYDYYDYVLLGGKKGTITFKRIK